MNSELARRLNPADRVSNYGSSVPGQETATASGFITRMVAWFMHLDFRRAIWLAPLAWTLHETEEWNINVFEKEHFREPGYFSLIDHSVLWLGLAQVALIGLLWTLLTAWPRNPRFAAFLTLPFFVYIPFANALQHVFFAFHFRTYAPGVVTAVLLVGPVVLGLTIKAVRGRLVPLWYAAIFYLATVPTLISTIQSPNQIPPNIQNARRNGVRTAMSILGRPPSDLLNQPRNDLE